MPQKNITIHMGTHKTGSSALQVFFALNKDWLLEHSYIYPGDNKEALDFKITAGNSVSLANFLRGDSGALLKNPLKDIGKHQGKNLLFSSETFSGFDVERVAMLKEAAQKYGYEIKIVFYVRSIAGYAYSQYGQLVKRNRATIDFDTYIRNHFVTPITQIKEAINAFGKDNVRLYNYDRTRNKIFQHFCKNILDISDANFVLHKRKINRSLNPSELQFMRYANKLGGADFNAADFSDILIYSQPDLNIQKFVSKASLDYIVENYREDLDFFNSCNIDAPIMYKDRHIKIRDTPTKNLNPFQVSVISILTHLHKNKN